MKGIDLSEWNGAVDFAKVKADGIEFVILRDGYRKAIDARFKEYAAAAKKAGLAVMTYHFIYVDGATAAQNADACVANLKAAGLDPAETWVFADLEYDTWNAAGDTCTKAKCTEYVEAFLTRLKALGCKRLGIYTNIDYHRNYYDWARLKGYKLWLADYSGKPDTECAIQQTGDKGRVNGISGNVDMDTLFDETMIGGKTMAKKCTAAEAVKAFEYWLGYYEKASSANASSREKSVFALNKGANNYTYMGYLCGVQGQPWCAATVTTAIYDACGQDKTTAKAVMYGVWPYVACNQLYDAAPANRKGRRGAWTPKAGDVIVFSDNGSVRTHTGMVYAADSKYVYTIEGNSANMVRKRSYPLTSSYVWGYVRPDYADSGNAAPTPATGDKYGKAVTVTVHELSKGCAGPEVSTIQRIIYARGIDKTLKVDGEFGPATQTGVKALQKQLGLAQDGVVGAETWKKVLGELE